VAVTSLRLVPSDYHASRYRDEFHIRLALQNKSDRDLRGIKGTVRFKDMFGTEINSIGLSYDDGIPAGKAATYAGTMKYNQFMDEDTRRASKSLDELKVEWIPDTYLFEDGTVLSMPTN